MKAFPVHAGFHLCIYTSEINAPKDDEHRVILEENEELI